MKKIHFYLVIITLVFSSLSCKRQNQVILRFSNSLETDRTGEVITIENKLLTNLTGEFPDNTLPLFISGQDTLVTQFIDLNNDQIPEEILIEINLVSKASIDVQVEFIPPAQYPVFPKKTNLRFADLSNTNEELISATRVQTTQTEVTSKVFQMEGPAWENNKVGFRNYFDLRNGMDIFGKSTPEMVLDKVGLGDDYHALSDWGMDILKVGNSLGAGAIGVDRNGKLYRIGDNGKGTFQRLYEGPLRSEFQFTFPDWQMESESYYISHYISITSGQYAYQSNVFANGLPENALIISGIVNMLSDKRYVVKADGYTIIYTHSFQSEDGKKLAMALLIPENYFKGETETPDSGPGIINTYYARMDLNGQKEAVFYFYALWETSDSRFANVDFVEEYLQAEALKLNNPVTISKIR